MQQKNKEKIYYTIFLINLLTLFCNLYIIISIVIDVYVLIACICIIDVLCLIIQ